MVLRIAVLAAVLVGAAACSTPYGDRGLFGGVDAYPISSNTYRIVARGNGFTEHQQVEDFVLLRSAEAAIEAGYRYFSIVSSADRTAVDNFTIPGSSQTNMTVTGYGNSLSATRQTSYTPAQTFQSIAPGQDVIVRFSTAPVRGAWDAFDVFNSIGPRYDLAPVAMPQGWGDAQGSRPQVAGTSRVTADATQDPAWLDNQLAVINERNP